MGRAPRRGRFRRGRPTAYVHASGDAGEAAASCVREAQFLGEPGAGILATTFAPQTTPQGCVVFSSGLFNDPLKNLRRETLLAERLAARGVASVRFDHRGVGNSGIDRFPLDVESMRDDLEVVIAFATERFETDAVAFLATRLGTVPFAAVASDAPFVLWDPVVEPSKYFRDFFRARMMSDMRRADGSRTSVDETIAAIEHDGSTDVLGYSIERALFEDLTGLVPHDLTPDGGPALVVQFTKKAQPRAELRELVERLEARGVDTTFAVSGVDESWFFAEDVRKVEDIASMFDGVLTTTATWLVNQVRFAA
jgi:pimeloyl-ACP methyl ester carboxylesterase